MKVLLNYCIIVKYLSFILYTCTPLQFRGKFCTTTFIFIDVVPSYFADIDLRKPLINLLNIWMLWIKLSK